MRSRGWGGDLPSSDEEAVERILRAARACIDENGLSTSIVDVASALNVTRQTVYRYFPSTNDLLRATAFDATGAFMERLASHVSGIADPFGAVVEMVAYLLESLPLEPYIGLLFTAERVSTFAKGVTSEQAMAVGHSLLQSLSVDWEEIGFSGERLDALVEHVLRLIQSLVLDPGGASRTGEELRRHLRWWLWTPLGSPSRPGFPLKDHGGRKK